MRLLVYWALRDILYAQLFQIKIAQLIARLLWDFLHATICDKTMFFVGFFLPMNNTYKFQMAYSRRKPENMQIQEILSTRKLIYGKQVASYPISTQCCIWYRDQSFECCSNQMTGFYIKCSTGLKWVNNFNY